MCSKVPRSFQLLHILLTKKRSSNRRGHVLDRLQRKKLGLDSLPHISLSFNCFDLAAVRPYMFSVFILFFCFFCFFFVFFCFCFLLTDQSVRSSYLPMTFFT